MVYSTMVGVGQPLLHEAAETDGLHAARRRTRPAAAAAARCTAGGGLGHDVRREHRQPQERAPRIRRFSSSAMPMLIGSWMTSDSTAMIRLWNSEDPEHRVFEHQLVVVQAGEVATAARSRSS